MKLHIFNDKTAILHGIDNLRLTSGASGTLCIGDHQTLQITEGTTVNLPLLNDSIYKAVFKTENGDVYRLGSIIVRGGRITPQTHLTAKEIELIHVTDELKEEVTALRTELDELKRRFDTNALNILMN